MGEAKIKRRQFFIKSGPQLGLMVRIYMILVSILVVTGVIFYLVGNKNLTMEFYQAHSVIRSTMELLLPALIVLNVLGLLAAFGLILFFTHSIAGPIHKLHKVSEKVQKGDFSDFPLRFRKGDSVGELAGIINAIFYAFQKAKQGKR